MTAGLRVQAEVAFVRLASGEVEQLAQGESLPEGVDDVEVQRLVAAGVVGADAVSVETPDPAAKPRGARS